MVAAQDVYGLTLFKSTGKGDQPMKYAMERATAQGHEFFIELVQRGEEGRETHLFGSTRDANAFLSLQQDIIREKGAYLDFREIIRADRPARFYADIEWKVPLDQRNDALALEVVSGVARAAEALARGRLAVDLDPARWVLARGSREKKGEWRESFHLTHLDFTFESNHVGMRLFAGALLLAGGTSVVDGKVYTKNRVFRVPWAAKVPPTVVRWLSRRRSHPPGSPPASRPSPTLSSRRPPAPWEGTRPRPRTRSRRPRRCWP